MLRKLDRWELRIIQVGLKVISIATFVAFTGWALLHLAKMFG